MLENLVPKKNKSEYCKIANTLAILDEPDVKILVTALEDRDTWSAKGLSNALRERGLSIADTTIAKHRNKVCACYRG